MSGVTVLVAVYSPVAAWNIPLSYVETLRRDFPEHTFVHAADEQQTLELIPPADAAFSAEIRPAHLQAATRLRWIHSSAAGVGNMLFPEMVARDVAITNSRGISADVIAEHVLAVTLAVFRKLPLVFGSQAARRWAQDEVLDPPALRTVAGSSVLIVGLGSIGTATARRMAALGARVLAIRRDTTQPAPEGVEEIGPPDRLLDLLPRADVVVIAAPQTRETRRLIGAAEFGAMRRGALLVNVSRGKLVDEAALVDALNAGTSLGAAALDVFEHEPLAAESPLWSMPQVLITPHIAGFRPDHWEAVTALFADNLRRFTAGEPLRNVVNKEAGY